MEFFSLGERGTSCLWTGKSGAMGGESTRRCCRMAIRESLEFQGRLWAVAS